MASHYIRLNYVLGSGVVDDRKVKVSSDDSNPAFLESKIVAGSTKLTTTVLNPGTSEQISLDVVPNQIPHDSLLNVDPDEHRTLDDTATTTTNLWSASKITDYIATELATQDEAIEIAYDNTVSGLTATTVKSAIDEVEGRLDTAETDLNNHLTNGAGKHQASEINYAGSPTLATSSVEVAIDTLEANKLDTADFGTEFDTEFALKSTSDLSEGANLYFTAERSQDAFNDLIVDSEILWTYNDGTNQMTANLDINGQTALTATGISDADEFLFYDTSTSTLKKITYAEFLKNSGNLSAGDIQETQANLVDNQAVAANITGLAFSNAVTRSFKAKISVERGTNFETVNITGVQVDNAGSPDWDIAISRVGDETGVTFSITSAGQIQYTSTSTGTAPKVVFRADTTKVAA